MANVHILVTSNDATNDHINRIKIQNDHPRREANELINYLSGLSSGFRAGKLDVQIQGDAGAYASGTLTLASVVATNACTVAGVTLTAVASGATSAQFNVGASDTATAANLASAINANASLTGVVTATSSGAVVTVSAFLMGAMGNQVPLVGGTNITAGAAKLAGGTYTPNIYSYGL